MKYKYANYRDAITLNKDSYIYWNGYTDYVSVFDSAIRIFEDWTLYHHAKLSIKKFKELKKNGSIEQLYVKSDSYWRFTAKTLAMDDILYAPYVRRKASK